MMLRNKKIVLISIVSLALILVGYSLWWPSKAISALPSNAKEVHEHYDGSINSDYTRLLRAVVSPEGFEEFTKTLILTKESCLTIKTTSIWSYIAPNIQWWNPSSDVTNMYCSADSSDRNFVIAKHENGVLYFKASSW